MQNLMLDQDLISKIDEYFFPNDRWKSLDRKTNSSECTRMVAIVHIYEDDIGQK